MTRITICGGGNAAHVLIALAAHAGWEVNVFAPLAAEARQLEAGAAAGGITARFRDRTIVGRAARVSTRAEQTVPGSELVLLALPAFAHGLVLQAVLDHLDPGAIVGALPARGGFDYQARTIWQAAKAGPAPAVTFFGLQTLPWACRIVSYGRTVEVLGVKAAVDLAAVPAGRAPDLAERLARLFGLKVNSVASFLTLTLANTGQLIHPGIMYGLCRDREEMIFSAGSIPLFYQGVTPDIANLLAAMSDEVQLIAAALAGRWPDFDPQQVMPLLEWLRRAYPADISDGSSLYSAFVTNQAYAGLRLPGRPAGPGTFVTDFTARYLAEDVPYGLVVVRGIAELAGVATPVLDSVISWAQDRLNRRYLVDGTLAGPDLAETRAPQAYNVHSLARLVEWSSHQLPVTTRLAAGASAED